MEGLRVYRELLRNRPLSRLLVGEFISGIGDWLYIVAIFVVIYRDSGDAALVGAFGGIRLLPYVLLSVPAGILADRFDRRMVLLVSDLFRGALMVAMAVLVETNELEALNFIDRVLKHLQTAIADDGLEIHVGVGWASSEPGGKLSGAIATAEERLATDFFHTR